MEHFLLVMKGETFFFGSYQQRKFELCRYKGDIETAHRGKDAIFWQNFWERMCPEKTSVWGQRTLTLLYSECSFADCSVVPVFPCDKGLTCLRIQEITSILPELVSKMGLLNLEHPVLVAWHDRAWLVNMWEATPATFEPGKPLYRLEDIDIANTFVSILPVFAEIKLPCEQRTKSPSTKLAHYVQSSKVKV